MSGDLASELRSQLRAGESERLEFKRTLRDPRIAAGIVAALANSGGGRLIVGADEHGGGVGVDDARRVQQIIGRAGDLVVPHVEVQIQEAVLDDGTLVVVDVAPPARGPVVAPDGAILRRAPDGRSVPLGGSDVAELVSSTPAPARLAEVAALLETVNQRAYDLQKTLDEEREAAASERAAQMAERAQAAKDRAFGARLTDWLIAGVIGAVLGGVVTIILG